MMESDPKFSPFCLLHDPALNKGTAFTEEERDELGLRGLLPPRVQSQTEQMLQVVANVRKKSSDLERYIFMMGLQDRNETLFYRTLLDHLEEMMPIIYTPTVGLACQEYGHIFRRPRGIFVSMRDAGRVRKILQNWPAKNVPCTGRASQPGYPCHQHQDHRARECVHRRSPQPYRDYVHP